MQKPIVGYIEILDSELEYLRARLQVVKDDRLLEKYKKEEEWINKQMLQLRGWLDKQGDDDG